MRVKIHYVVSVLVLTYYSAVVCPYITNLTVPTRLTIFIYAFVPMYLFRILLLKLFVHNAPYLSRVKRQYFLELGLFVTAGLIVTIYDLFSYSFPLTSGLKVILGTLALGFFAATDLSIELERKLYEHLKETGEEVKISGRYVPLPIKFLTVASMTLIFITITGILIILKDIAYLHATTATISEVAGSFEIESSFVGAVFFIELINLIVSYSLNTKIFFDNENKALTDVAEGNLKSRVTVSTDDEFGVMGAYTNKMISDLQQRTEELQHTQEVTILSLASLAETRDNETGAHILRTQRYVKALSEHLKHHSKFSSLLAEDVINLLFQSAPLHDIGKVGIRDAILLKPGKLTDEEFEEMKKHTIYGYNALQEGQRRLGSNSFLRLAGEITISHHEKWDGTGYPKGLRHEDIPLSGRLMALADVYDALISKRVYKDAFPHGTAKEIIVKGKGSHFDPDMCDAFLAIEDEFLGIAEKYGDHTTHKIPEKVKTM
ncbi:MAG: HD domain-containing protein [Nitrospirae bacterium]|nr:HD domain-containing protein [Nitrospirota bacterium]